MAMCSSCLEKAKRIGRREGRHKFRAVELAPEEILTAEMIDERRASDGVCDICGYEV